MPRRTLGLRPAQRVQRHVTLSLEPALGVIRRLAVPPEH
jgi:hypothetical protein